jgi:hypothetical protein
LSALHGKKVFSSIDIVAAFWQVPLSKRSVELTAFTTPDGSYEWVRMPMGLSTASGVFSKFIDEVFSGLKWHVVLTYIDDCLIYSGTVEEHLAALRAVFERLRDHGLTLGAEKCHLCTSSVRFLGHLVTADGIRPDSIKIAAIQDWEMPTDKKSLRSTLGFFNYYRRFCKNYSSIAQPLNVLLTDKTKLPRDHLTGAVVWTPDQLKSFEILKSTLLRDAVLAHPDFTQPFIIDTDACAHGLGAVLSQRVGDRTMPVAFSSRSLTPAERAYTVWELETLAVYWACTIYNWYLWNQEFIVRTDSKAVEWVLGEASKGRMLKWALSLQELKFKITHRSGAKHGNADAMSRCPLEEWSKCPYGGAAQEPLYGVAPPIIVGVAARSTTKATAYAAVSGGTRSKSRASRAQAPAHTSELLRDDKKTVAMQDESDDCDSGDQHGAQQQDQPRPSCCA